MKFKYGNSTRGWGSRGYVGLLLVLLPVVDFWVKIGPPYPWGEPLLTSVIAFAAMFGVSRSRVFGKSSPLAIQVAFGFILLCAATGYAFLCNAFISERFYENGKKERVVLGYALRPELEIAIQSATESDIARGTYQKMLTRGSSGRTRRSEEDIRQQAIDETIELARNPSAPYSRPSRAVIAGALLVLWELAFASAALLIATSNFGGEQLGGAS